MQVDSLLYSFIARGSLAKGSAALAAACDLQDEYHRLVPPKMKNKIDRQFDIVPFERHTLPVHRNDNILIRTFVNRSERSILQRWA